MSKSESVKKIEDMIYKNGMTQKQFAERIGVSNVTISNWLNEEININPSFKSLEKICKAFDLDMDYFTGRITEKTHDIKGVCEITGLSPEAAEALINYNKSMLPSQTDNIPMIDFISQMLLQDIF